MTKERLIELARAAGWQYADGDSGYEPLWRFAALVAAFEREECAKVCDANAEACNNNSMLRDVLAGNAAAIRARGTNE